MQSSLAPTQARCCSDANLPKKVGTKNIHLYAAATPRARPETLGDASKTLSEPAVASAARSNHQKAIRTAASRTRREPKKWPRPLLNLYGSAAAPPSASPRKREAHYQGAPRDHEPRVTARGAPKNAPSSSSRRPGSRMRINPVYRDYERYQGRRRKVEQGCE